jgi:hypothetical protein
MAEPLIRCKIRDAEVIFILGGDDDEATVDDCDAIIVLADGSRWSVSFLTLDAIARIMVRCSESGDYRSGAYFRIPDPVISSKPGLANMLVAVEDLINRRLDGLLPRLEEENEE